MYSNDASNIRLIKVEKSQADARLVMEWRNNPQTLQMFYHQEPKIWPDFFVEFLDNYFETPSYLFPLFAEANGEKVAFLKFGLIDDNSNSITTDISINIAPAYRGKGLAAPIIDSASKLLKKSGVSQIVAEIRRINIPSIKSFQRAGFTIIETTSKLIPDTQETAEIVRLCKKL